MPGKPHDTLHDYRPDPEFVIKSRLNTQINNSHDESALFDEELSEILEKGEDLLDDYHQKFYNDFLVGELKAEIAEPIRQKSPADQEKEEKGPAWKDIKFDRQLPVIRQLSWHQLIDNLLKAKFPDKDPDAKPETYWYKDYVNYFPYIEAVCRKLPYYSEIKNYFLSLGKVFIKNNSESLIDFSKDPENEDQSEMRKAGRRIMWGVAAFRNAYVNYALKKIREGNSILIEGKETKIEGLKIVHKMIGDINPASNYRVIVGGADDVAAVAEFCRSFRAEWLAEPGTLFEAHVYCRKWLPVAAQTLHPSAAAPTDKDESLQVQALDFIGDIYGLAKIRRYVSKVEWAAFSNAVQRDLKVDGLKTPQEPTDAGDDTLRLKNSEVPLFKRFDWVDEIYKKQFVDPLLKFRGKDVYDKFQKSDEGMEQKGYGIDIDERAPQTLERLFHHDRDKMLRACSLAYLELMARTRKIESDLKNDKLDPERKTSGDFKWYQNEVDEKGTLTEIDSGLSAEGMTQFMEYSSLLTSEAALFANESYFTQGAVWSSFSDAQAETLFPNINAFHRLQYFNEQIGEGLKELRTRLRKMKDGHDIDEALKEYLEKEEESAENKEDPDLAEEALNSYIEYLETRIKIHGGENKERRTTLDGGSGKEHGMARALKHIVLFLEGKELRDGKEVELDAPRQTIKNRIEEYQTLFPDITPTDALDIESLKIELKLGEIFQELLGKLKAIAWGEVWENHDKKSKKEDYSTLTIKEREQKARKLLEETIKEGSEFNKLVNDGGRADADLRYGEAAKDVDTTKYNPPPGNEAEHVWGLRHLTHHLLRHAAAVNNKVRRLLSESPVSVSVKKFDQ